MNLFGLKPAAAPPPAAPPAAPLPQPPTAQEAGSFGQDLSNLIGQSVISPTAHNAVPLAPPPPPAALPPSPAPLATPVAVAPPLAPPVQAPLPPPPATPVTEPLQITIGGPLGAVPVAPQIVITPDRSEPAAAPLPVAAPHADQTHVNAVAQVAEKIRKSLGENSDFERQGLASDALSIDAELNSLEQQEIELHQLLSQLDGLKDTLRERRGGLAERIRKMDAMDQDVLAELKDLES